MGSSIQISIPMHVVNNTHLETIIREVCQFSTLRMFGHLFNLRHGLEAQLKKIEGLCSTILEMQLRQATIPQNTSSSQAQLTLINARLEQALAVCFNTTSPFWEQFYARQQGSGTGHIAEDVLNTPEHDLQHFARSGLPCFYTMIDALHFGASQSDHVYTLIQLSLQSYLKGMLLTLTTPEEANPAFAQAIKLLGPVNAPLFRDLMIQKLTP